MEKNIFIFIFTFFGSVGLGFLVATIISALTGNRNYLLKLAILFSLIAFGPVFVLFSSL